MDRRSELTDQALDYVLEHGLLNLSLRPLAAALGTSDRMLVYHFGSKDRLVIEILDCAQQRLAADIGPLTAPPPDLRGLILQLWTALTTPATAGVTRLYLETCILADRDPGQWSTAPSRLRDPWRQPLVDGLLAYGVAPRRAPVLAELVLATFDGLALDRSTTTDPARTDAAAELFADLVTSAADPV